MQPYTINEILLARIEALIALGLTREEADKLVAETCRTNRLPGA